MRDQNKTQLYYVQRSFVPRTTVKWFLRIAVFRLPQETLLPRTTVTLVPSTNILYISHLYTLFKISKIKKYFNCGSKSVQIKSTEKPLQYCSEHQESTGLIVLCFPQGLKRIDGIFDDFGPFYFSNTFCQYSNTYVQKLNTLGV